MAKWRAEFVTTLANAVICHCEHAKSVLGRRFGRRWGVHVIPHGSFADAYPRKATRAEARRAFDIPDDAFVYGYFGNIRAYKGVERLIEEFGSLEGDRLAPCWWPARCTRTTTGRCTRPRSRIHA